MSRIALRRRTAFASHCAAFLLRGSAELCDLGDLRGTRTAAAKLIAETCTLEEDDGRVLQTVSTVDYMTAIVALRVIAILIVPLMNALRDNKTGANAETVATNMRSKILTSQHVLAPCLAQSPDSRISPLWCG